MVGGRIWDGMGWDEMGLDDRIRNGKERRE